MRRWRFIRYVTLARVLGGVPAWLMCRSRPRRSRSLRPLRLRSHRGSHHVSAPGAISLPGGEPSENIRERVQVLRILE